MVGTIATAATAALRQRLAPRLSSATAVAAAAVASARSSPHRITASVTSRFSSRAVPPPATGGSLAGHVSGASNLPPATTNTGTAVPGATTASVTTAATAASTPAASFRAVHNQALAFPCVDRNTEREVALSGPEPAYGDGILRTGFETFRHEQPFQLVHGGELPGFQIAYESWGELNADRSNAVLLCTGLSASSHARSQPKNTSPGWWERFIGPGLPLDTDRFHIICTNVLGGCFGSTGPSSVDPRTGRPFATTFPIVTIWDMVRAQFKMLDAMGIERLHACVGSSMGGMQSLAAAALFPSRVGRVVSVSAAARSHPFSIALRFVQRQILMSDPNWNRGFYYDGIPPHVGMKLAREVGTITYRSGPEWELRFGRTRAVPDAPPALCADYLIETYLDHQGEKFCLQYDANSLLYISKAMDMFDMSAIPANPESDAAELAAQRQVGVDALKQEYHAGILSPLHALSSASGSASEALAAATRAMDQPASPHEVRTDQAHRAGLVAGMSAIRVPTLVVGCQSDILFPVWQQKEVVECLRAGGNDAVTYVELDAMYGHDTFLIDLNNVGGAVRGHL
ncbi:hypothetical protein HK405_013818, partial [Cladochytrium tenue]